jgi:hypothetical protein
MLILCSDDDARTLGINNLEDIFNKDDLHHDHYTAEYQYSRVIEKDSSSKNYCVYNVYEVEE